MRIIVCGGREYNNYKLVDRILDALCPEVLVTGDASGADTLAALWAQDKTGPTLRRHVADWDKYKKAAGPIRNKEMLEANDPDLVVAFPGGSGTADMVKQALAAGVPVLKVLEPHD